MTQFSYGTINPATKNGTDLAADLSSALQAWNTNHKGTSRPSYAVAGMLWNKDVSAAAQEINYFDGTDDIKMQTVDTTNNRTIFYPYSLNFFTGSHQIITDATKLYLRPNGSTTGEWYFGTAGQLVASDAANRALIMSSDNAAVDATASTNTGLSVGSSGALSLQQDSAISLRVSRRTSNGDCVAFYRNLVSVGSISVTTTATAYNTSSDYRLKYDIKPMYEFTTEPEEFEGVPDIIKRVLEWRPVTFKMHQDEDDTTLWGFIAHELQEFAPYAVTGEKDGSEALGIAYSVKPAEIVQDITEADALAAGLVAWEWDGVAPINYPAESYQSVSEADAMARGCETWSYTNSQKTVSLDGSTSYVDYGIGVKAAYSEPEKGVATRPEIRQPSAEMTKAEAISAGFIDWEETRTRPVYQAVDHSKLVPELAAALQSTLDLLLETRLQVRKLTERLEQLEG